MRILIVLLLAGCTHPITRFQMDVGRMLCQNHGGVRTLHPAKTSTVTCLDDTSMVIEWKTRETI